MGCFETDVSSRRPEPRPCDDSLSLLDAADRAWLEEGYASLLPIPDTTEPHLRDLIRDVLAHPGRLVRAQVTFAVGCALGIDRRQARSLAMSVEYFHTASLLFDDLPAMDDARVRRDRPCPHLVQGEGAAILGALAFVNQGYALLWEALGALAPRRFERARQLVGRCLGTHGVLQGQALDLRFDSSPGDEDAVLRVADGKTVSLVRLSLVLPAIAGAADEATLERLDRLSLVWGRSYQILDDFKDCVASDGEAGKTTARDAALRRPNLPLAAGGQRAMTVVSQLLREGRELLTDLDGSALAAPAFERLQARLERERERVALRLEALQGSGATR